MIPKIFKRSDQLEARKFKVPSIWEEVTLKEFLAFISIEDPENDMPAILEVFTGIDKADWMTKSVKAVELAAGTLRFINQPIPSGLSIHEVSNEIEKVNQSDKNDLQKRELIKAILAKFRETLPKEVIINNKPVQVPNDVLNPAYAAMKDIQNAINSFDGKNEYELLSGILACLLYESYTKGKYDTEKAMKIIPWIESAPAYQLFPIGFFFLISRGLSRKIGRTGSQGKTRKSKKWKRALKGLIGFRNG